MTPRDDRQAATDRRKEHFFTSASPALVVVLSLAALALLIIALVIVRPFEATDPAGDASTVDELDASLASALGELAESSGVEGLQTSYVEGHLASAVWFDYRANGDVAVVQRVDRDVLESGWWLGPSDAPPAVGENIVTILRVLVDDSFYEATLEGGEAQGAWSTVDREAAPPGPLALGVLFLTEETNRLAIPIDDGDLQRTDVAGGGSVWSSTSPIEGGIAVQTWDINPDGTLDSYTWELIGADPPLGSGDDPVTGGRIDFRRVDEPEPIAAPDVDAVPDPAVLRLPPVVPLNPTE